MRRKKIEYTLLLFFLILMIGASIILNLILANYVPKLGLGEFRLHLLDYSILTVLLSLFLFIQFKNIGKNIILFISGFIIWLFSTIIEVFQLFVPNRSFELFDLEVNMLGISLGLFISFIFYQLYIRLKTIEARK
jgi:VanZ family protein